MATVNIGNLTFTHKGDYASGTAYVKNDVVYYATNGNAYIAKQATQGNAPTSTAHWDVFAAGSGGIWNAGLSLGSASQKLRVNSGGNALEFFTEPTVTSDYVKIIAGTHSGTELNIDNVFTGTYDLYKVYLNDVAVTSSWLGMRGRTGGASGTTYSGSEYRYVSKMFYKPSGGASDTGESGWSDTNFRVGWTNSESVKPHTFEFTIPNPNSTSYKFSYYMNNLHLNNTYVGAAVGAGTIDISEANQFTGLNFFQSGGSSFSMKYKVYGIKS